ncbi:MAG: hypothetical protein E5W99_26470, partial [Mesorhizobium sp.]
MSQKTAFGVMQGSFCRSLNGFPVRDKPLSRQMVEASANGVILGRQGRKQLLFQLTIAQGRFRCNLEGPLLSGLGRQNVNARQETGSTRLDDAARAGWLYYVAGNT